MLRLLYFILFFFHTIAQAQSIQLERINFYPNAKAYLKTEYAHQTLLIDTPQTSVNTKEIKNINNLFFLTYAYKFKYFFIGIKNTYERASESAVKYGIPVPTQYHSQGFKEPEVFLSSRLREQYEDIANIDLFVSFVDSLGSREVGESSGNRLYGGNILTARLSHGATDEEWEFRNSLQYQFFDEGEEINNFTSTQYQLGSYNVFTYLFMGQYAFNAWSFINAGVGVEYRTVQHVNAGDGDKKELQAGTGSIARVGYKIPFSSWTLAEFLYEFKRNSYFVKSQTNFDGQQTQHSFLFSLTQAF